MPDLLRLPQGKLPKDGSTTSSLLHVALYRHNKGDQWIRIGVFENCGVTIYCASNQQQEAVGYHAAHELAALLENDGCGHYILVAAYEQWKTVDQLFPRTLALIANTLSA